MSGVRKILVASLTMGLSSVAVIAAGIARNKVFALTLGAEGLGVVALLTTGLSVLGVAFGLGLAQSGVQQVVRAKLEGQSALRLTERALVTGTFWLGLIAALALLALRDLLARLVLREESASSLLTWVAAALWATVASSGRLALLNGLDRIRTLAMVNGLSALLGSVVAVAAVIIWGRGGLGMALLAPPLTTWVLAIWETRSSEAVLGNGAGNVQRIQLHELFGPLSRMLRLGAVVALAVLVSTAMQFGLRVLLERTLGLGAAGQFQAAWNISSVYLGFVLGALGAEYFPRLSGLAHHRASANRAVNNQINLTLTLAAPIILASSLLAPELVHLLYAPEFAPAAHILRWQLLGDVFKIASWALAYLLLAHEARDAYFLSELGFNATFAFFALLALDQLGLEWIGIAYTGAYFVYAVLTVMLAVYRVGFVLDLRTAWAMGWASFTVFLSTALLEWGGLAGWWTVLALTVAMGGFALTLLVRTRPWVREMRVTP